MKFPLELISCMVFEKIGLICMCDSTFGKVYIYISPKMLEDEISFGIN